MGPAVSPVHSRPGAGVLQRACACGGTSGEHSPEEGPAKHLQSKLVVGQVSDPLEREADRVADVEWSTQTYMTVFFARLRNAW